MLEPAKYLHIHMPVDVYNIQININREWNTFLEHSMLMALSVNEALKPLDIYVSCELCLIIHMRTKHRVQSCIENKLLVLRMF